MHLVMLLSNPFRPDPRVAREAHALVEQGYHVTIICWDRQVELPRRESHDDQDGVEIIRVQDVRSGYSLGWQQLFYLPRFWRKATQLALELSPDAVHCHDLDTLYAGWRIKKWLRCPLVYDAHEHYPALMSLYLPAPFVMALAQWERWLMRYVDITITASTVLRDEFLSRGQPLVVTLGNYQDVASYAAVTDAEAHALRAELGVSPDDLLVAYIGGFSHNRMLLPLIETAALLPHAKFHLWGDGPQRAAIEQAVVHQPNIYYHGWASAANLPYYFRAADLIYYCLRLDYPGAVYNAPNTLTQAMAAGRPIIANDVGDLGRIVRATQCGLLIGEATPQAIAGAIEQLQDPLARARMGANGLRAARDIYNTAVVQRQLVEIYHTLLK
jgi:glycosyltransferase involved in cell wall biosynthesis